MCGNKLKIQKFVSFIRSWNTQCLILIMVFIFGDARSSAFFFLHLQLKKKPGCFTSLTRSVVSQVYYRQWWFEGLSSIFSCASKGVVQDAMNSSKQITLLRKLVSGISKLKIVVLLSLFICLFYPPTHPFRRIIDLRKRKIFDNALGRTKQKCLTCAKKCNRIFEDLFSKIFLFSFLSQTVYFLIQILVKIM